MKITRWSFALLTVCWLGGGQAAHITDKLLAGLYEEPSSGQKPVKLLASGTPVDVLEKRGGYQRVKLADGTEGWVNGSYVTEEKPAQVKLSEAQARMTELEAQLAEAVAQACPPEEESAPSVPDASVLDATPGSSEQPTEGPAEAPPSAADCGPIQTELATVQARMAEAAGLLGAPLEPVPVSLASPARWVPYWPWIAVAVALLIGFFSGILLIQHRFSKRFGKGFRF
jgi:hypothetical protein